MVNLKLEVVVLPVSDVDQAKRFYATLGFREDIDYVAGNGTSAWAIHASRLRVLNHHRQGNHVGRAGLSSGSDLVVNDIEAARAELVGRGDYDKYRHDFAKLIWQIASPKWRSDDATFERSAAFFNNPDHVSIVIHNYRWRFGLAEGEPKYDDLEKRLAEFPLITMPTITLESDANGAPHPDASSYAKKFSGKYSHRIINGGIGHNLPQEAPQAFA